MKPNQRKFITSIIALMFIVGFFFIQNSGYLSNTNSNIYVQPKIRTSGTYENITIDNLPGSWNNWTWAENQVWCSGLGTLENPYIIQDHTLGIDSLADGIKISNSNNISFIIKNCTFFWDGSISIGSEKAITLDNTTNGLVSDNNIAINGMGTGVYLNECEDIIIANNTVYNTMNAIYLIQSNYSEVIDNTAYSSVIGVSLSISDNNIIYNNTVYSNTNGIKVSNSKFNEIYRNKANNNNDNGILLWFSDNNTITENNLNDNNNDGIEINNGHYNTISGNIANDNNIAGIYLTFSDYNNITENTGSGNIDGIFLESDCDNNIVVKNIVNRNNVGIEVFYDDFNSIIGNTANDNNYYGIRLEGSNNNTVTGNTLNNNTAYGMYIHEHAKNNTISENTAYNNTEFGIYLEDCEYNTITKNTANDNNLHGIHLYDCDYNNITGNTASNNTYYGIYLENSCNNNTISGNTANGNGDYGIWLNDNCDDNSISGNTANDNGHGIVLWFCDYNNIIGNTANDHAGDIGIYLFNSDYNAVSKNTANYNGDGISLQTSHYNNITGNTACNNTQSGIYLDSSNNNSIYGNFFLKNEKHAIDDGTDNNWNSTAIGNYWDNWTSPDTTPQDGIVDDPYIYIGGSAGSIDYLPIAEDGAPSIAINSPDPGGVFGTTAPSFNVRITDDYIDEMWYTIDGGLNNYTFTDNGTIDQSAWDALSDGTITLIFYASDIPGYIGFADVNIVKDITGPIIIINSPSSGSEFGVSAPAFIITITDDHLDSIWYSLDGGVTTHAITTNATIDQTAWSALSEGSITITFYANDTIGNLSFEELTITKSIPPAGDDLTILIVIIVVSVVGGVAVIAGLYIFMKKRATPE